MSLSTANFIGREAHSTPIFDKYSPVKGSIPILTREVFQNFANGRTI
jgi:hypothetical protein